MKYALKLTLPLGFWLKKFGDPSNRTSVQSLESRFVVDIEEWLNHPVHLPRHKFDTIQTTHFKSEQICPRFVIRKTMRRASRSSLLMTDRQIVSFVAQYLIWKGRDAIVGTFSAAGGWSSGNCHRPAYCEWRIEEKFNRFPPLQFEWPKSTGY